MNIKVVEDQITVDELRQIAKEFYVSMIKGVVDIETGRIAFGGEYHMDTNTLLIDCGSKQSDIWGFNIELNRPRDSWIEYIALINIRPQDNNRDMEVQDPAIRAKMKQIIDSKIK